MQKKQIFFEISASSEKILCFLPGFFCIQTGLHPGIHTFPVMSDMMIYSFLADFLL